MTENHIDGFHNLCVAKIYAIITAMIDPVASKRPAIRGRLWVLLAVIAVIYVFSLGPIAQDIGYHQFADQRLILGLPNFWNLISNLPFLLVGVWGLRRKPNLPASLKSGYLVFVIAVMVVALGSAYYHLQPTTASLLWDRLPMTVAFMAFFAMVLGDRIHERLGRRSLLGLVVLGLFSVFWWWWSEQSGQGDLRLYILVQYLPLVLLPVILVLYPNGVLKGRPIWWALAAYAGAKVLELSDMWIYQLTAESLSGHSLKHGFAALGVALIIVATPQKDAD